MKYEFHVGDYVETKNGAKGYVKDPKSLWWVCTVAANGYTPGLAYSIIGVSNNGMSEFFNRIGQYDFVKKDESKIEPLIIGRSVLTFMNNQGDNINIGHMVDKINELVEAVNRLEGKVNEMA